VEIKDLEDIVPISLVGSLATTFLLEKLVELPYYRIEIQEDIGEVCTSLVSSNPPPFLTILSCPETPAPSWFNRLRLTVENSFVLGVTSTRCSELAELLTSGFGVDRLVSHQEPNKAMTHIQEMITNAVLMPGHLNARKDTTIRKAMAQINKLRHFTVADWAYETAMSETGFRRFWKLRCGTTPIDAMRLWRIFRVVLHTGTARRNHQDYVQRLISRSSGHLLSLLDQ